MARIQFGSPGRSSFGFSYFPPVIKALLISNVGIFLGTMLFSSVTIFGEPLDALITMYGALWPIDSPYFGVWQLVSYMFLHGGLGHVLMNMFALWMFGVEVENTWGSKKFLTYYLLCGLGGAAAHLILTPLTGGGYAPLVGASAGVFGILVAFGWMFPDRMIFFYFLFPIKAKYFVSGYILLELFALWNPGADNISHLGHLGGAFMGLAYLMAGGGSSAFSFSQPQPKKDDSRRDAWRAFADRETPFSDAKQSDNPVQYGGGMFGRRKKLDEQPVEAEYYDVMGRSAKRPDGANGGKSKVITQAEIDKILDKIAASGYQNLTNEEREILFEASKRMDERK